MTSQAKGEDVTARVNIFRTFLFKLFVVVSVADLLLTTWLLSAHGRWVIESNPVANWWLERLGIAGLAAFKAATVVIVGLACQRLARLRPRLSQVVLSGACLTVLGVVVYSVYLGTFLGRLEDHMQAIEKHTERLQEKHTKLMEYRKLVNLAVDDLELDRTTLKHAVDNLVQTAQAQDPTWTEQMKISYGSDSLAVCVAKNLIQHFRVHPTAHSGEVLDRLQRQLRSQFGEESSVGTFDMGPVF